MSGFADPYQSFHLLMQFTYGSVVLGAARQITNAELGRDEAELRGWMVDNVGSITRPRTTRGQIARALLPEAHEELFEQELRSGRPIHVLDVRTQAEFDSATGHIPRAKCLPLHRLGTGEGVGCAHSHPIVVVSERGISAKLAAVELEL